MTNKALSLSELLRNVQDTINKQFSSDAWLVAEISELNVNYSGHCYMELIEKEDISDNIIAKSRATIWARNFSIINSYFETTTRESLKAGIKILVKVNVVFHQLYGFSLNVVDIDPSYTVGELAMKRALIIEKLTNDGVIEMNQMLELPLVPQRIAIITSSTAAGYGDFIKHLNEKADEIQFHTKLFNAVVQGNNAPQSIIEAFNQIYNELDSFDAVVLIRGGGSKIDLSCFDDYDLAYFITQFPLPVITGIGHDRDHSVTDLVANTSLKTPTAVADFLLNQLINFNEMINDNFKMLSSVSNDFIRHYEDKQDELSKDLMYFIRYKFDLQTVKLNNLEQKIKQQSELFLDNKTQFIQNLNNNIVLTHKNKISECYENIENKYTILKNISYKLIKKQENKLSHIESVINLVNPQNVLNRGFAIVKFGNKLLTNSNQVKPNDEIEVTLAKGRVKGKVVKN